ncbi:MAG: alanine racemase [Acidobacteria bacterium]|nr:alanine racemase [Acidobacteriota bacterium]
MIRSTVARIDLDALIHNFRTIRGYLATARVGTPTRIGTTTPGVIGVVKANAYGHGAAAVALALEQAGADMVACADIEEAILLREAGLRCRVLVFGALSLSALDGIFDHDLTPTLSSPMAARAVQSAAERRGVRVRCHLKIDTGMNRLGFRHDNLDRTMPAIAAAANLEIEAVYTHFATADSPGDEWFAQQQARFDAARARLAAHRIRPRLVHAANSAATLSAPGTWFDLVRPGLLMYGVSPGGLEHGLTLKPVMSLHSRVVAVKGVRRGEITGYGGRFTADRPTTIAIVPAGYADGLDARLAGRGHVLIRGRLAPIVGSVCMDMILVDVTGTVVEPGDAVTIIGQQGEGSIGVAEMARAIGTIPYELLCRVGTRIERIYNRESQSR